MNGRDTCALIWIFAGAQCLEKIKGKGVDHRLTGVDETLSTGDCKGVSSETVIEAGDLPGQRGKIAGSTEP